MVDLKWKIELKSDSTCQYCLLISLLQLEQCCNVQWASEVCRYNHTHVHRQQAIWFKTLERMLDVYGAFQLLTIPEKPQ